MPIGIAVARGLILPFCLLVGLAELVVVRVVQCSGCADVDDAAKRFNQKTVSVHAEARDVDGAQWVCLRRFVVLQQATEAVYASDSATRLANQGGG